MFSKYSAETKFWCNSDTNVRKTTGNNPKVDLDNIDAYIKFGEILSICSQDIEQKQNFGINKGP